MVSSNARPRVRRKKNPISFMAIKDAANAYGMIAPFFILLGVFSFYVFYSGFRMSVSDAQGISAGDYIGFQNYKDLLYADEFASAEFWRAVKVTFKFMFGCLATQVPAAFLLAFVLNQIPLLRIRVILRSAFFLPVLINTVVISILFRMFFLRDTGIINHVLGLLHLPNNIDWLMNSEWALTLLVIVSFWQWTGFHMVYFLSQLQTIDPTLYEAARLDGASPVKVLFRITLPLMRPAITFVMVTSAIGCLQMFDMVFILFPNASYGPGGVAKTLVAYIYDQGFSQEFLTGFASAIGWLTFLIIMLVSLLQLKMLGLGKHDEA
ncbi:MAG: sugar ABC transporter permease [Deltaproteobacteria bacterium]|nr:sugar ABC transporter permease [Deltaproteobacteria bacterium]